MSVIIGWWAIPLFITGLAFVVAINVSPNGYGMGNSIVGALNLGLALIVSLIAWLIWAVLT